MGKIIKNYPKYLEKCKRRNEKIIVKLRKEGKTLITIAKICKLTVERVRQILKKYGKDIDIANIYRVYKCIHCGTNVYVNLKISRCRKVCNACKALKGKYNICSCGKRISRYAKACRKCARSMFLHDKIPDIIKWYTAGYSTTKIAKHLSKIYTDRTLNTIQTNVNRVLKYNNIKMRRRGNRNYSLPELVWHSVK